MYNKIQRGNLNTYLQGAMAALDSSLESKIDNEVVWKESIDRRC